MKYLHQMDYIHRDLKAANGMLTALVPDPCMELFMGYGYVYRL